MEALGGEADHDMTGVEAASTSTASTPLLVDEEEEEEILAGENQRSSASISRRNDSCTSIVKGILTCVAFGTTIGVLIHARSLLNHQWESLVSSCLGYTYFIMWSISFYPQVWLNWQRQTTLGFSVDFAWLNVIGFACYTTYNLSLYYNASIRHQYQQRHPESQAIPVQFNDVAFAVHALLLSGITLLQIGYFDGLSQCIPSLRTRFVMGLIGIAMMVSFLLWALWSSHFSSLDCIYVLSFIKIGITCIKYIPQVILNAQRQSTAGWNIWQIVLDLSGGIFSILQLLFDCYFIAKDWSGVTGNLPKLILGNVSICFDVLFILQHYVLYASPQISLTHSYQPMMDVEESNDASLVEDPVATTQTCPS